MLRGNYQLSEVGVQPICEAIGDEEVNEGSDLYVSQWDSLLSEGRLPSGKRLDTHDMSYQLSTSHHMDDSPMGYRSDRDSTVNQTGTTLALPESPGDDESEPEYPSARGIRSDDLEAY